MAAISQLSNTMEGTSSEPTPLLPPGVGRPFALVTSLFFLWGIPNSMNDVLIRQFMKSFAISRFEAGLVQSAFYMGYFLLALPAGLLMKRRGYKYGFITGLCLFATGCFLFLPAANEGKYGFFLAALFVVASGLAFLETASNPFIAQLGPSQTAERRLNLSQAFNPLGCITGILLGTAFIFSGVELSPAQIAAKQANGTYVAYMHAETLRVVTPYLVIGCFALIWALMIGLTKFPSFLQEREHKAEVSGNWRDLLHQRHFLLAVLAQFVQCGAQVCLWSYFIQYAREYAHTTDKLAGVLLACVLVVFGIGRFASTGLMHRFSPSNIMTIYGVTNACLILFALLHPSWAGLIALLLTSFFLSLMFPTIFAMGLKDLGPNTNIGGSFIVMAIVGGAVFTPLMGLLAEKIHSTAHAFIVPLLGMLFVAGFARYMKNYDMRRVAN
ncbi:MAG TPA: L-fucose:H+ symporter permease [Acidobacteriaceae bacterium]